eukprot:31514-Pelagococcus_subviridis.AAC.14
MTRHFGIVENERSRLPRAAGAYSRTVDGCGLPLRALVVRSPRGGGGGGGARDARARARRPPSLGRRSSVHDYVARRRSRTVFYYSTRTVPRAAAKRLLPSVSPVLARRRRPTPALPPRPRPRPRPRRRRSRRVTSRLHEPLQSGEPPRRLVPVMRRDAQQLGVGAARVARVHALAQTTQRVRDGLGQTRARVLLPRVRRVRGRVRPPRPSPLIRLGGVQKREQPAESPRDAVELLPPRGGIRDLDRPRRAAARRARIHHRHRRVELPCQRRDHRASARVDDGGDVRVAHRHVRRGLGPLRRGAHPRAAGAVALAAAQRDRRRRR